MAELRKERHSTKEDIKKRKIEHKKLSKIKFDMSPYYSTDYSDIVDIDLITVSFNNPKVIEYQIKFIRKNIKGKYKYIVCDNSNVKSASEEIRKICEKEDITYIRVNSKLVPNGYSDSHGIALNWIYENIIKKRQNNFAFLDHDIFPIKEINVCEYLAKQDFYGFRCKPHKAVLLNDFGKMWYLWPGFSFYRYAVLKNKNVNFRKWRRFGLIKVVGADTGSANWPSLYSKYVKADYIFSNSEHCSIRENPDFVWDGRVGLAQEDLIQYMDDKKLLHLIKGSEWAESNGKLEIAYKMLDNYLQK